MRCLIVYKDKTKSGELIEKVKSWHEDDTSYFIVYKKTKLVVAKAGIASIKFIGEVK